MHIGGNDFNLRGVLFHLECGHRPLHLCGTTFKQRERKLKWLATVNTSQLLLCIHTPFLVTLAKTPNVNT